MVGASGLVGSHVYTRLRDHVEVTGTRRVHEVPGLHELDATDPEDVIRFFRHHPPFTHVVSCLNPPGLAWCEKHPEVSHLQQVQAHAHLAAALQDACALIVFSTDYVFDGEGAPYEEHAEPNPLQVYGAHKLEMEATVERSPCRVWVLRTSVVYGTNRLDPTLSGSYVELVRRSLTEGRTVSASHDQVSCPTWAASLAEVVEAIVAGKVLPGTWHAAGRTACTRYEFAEAIVERFGLEDRRHLIQRTSLRTAESEADGGGLRRPRDSRLASGWLRSAVGDGALCGHHEGLRRMRG